MALLLLLAGLLTLALVLLHRKRARPLPPGPRSVPLLGSLPFITTRRGMLDWALDPAVTRQPLATVWLGSLPFFIINCPTLARSLFDKEEFSGRRVPEWVIPFRFKNGGLGVVNNSGPQWTVQRRFALKTLKDFGLGRKIIEESIHFEIAEMIDTFVNTKGDVKLGSDFNVPIINILWQIVASARFNLDNPKDASLMECVRDIFDNGFKTDFCPVFLTKMFPKLSGRHRMTETIEEMNLLFGEIIEEHQQNLDSGNPKDFIDAYLVETERHGDTMNKEELTNCIWDFFLAGTETSSTTLKWAVLYLTLHPTVQDRCRQELQDTVGSARVTMADLPSLPFLQATIAEVQRLACVAPLSLPHYTQAPTTVGEFTFPAKSVFFANLSFISNDPDHFNNASDFDPTRFLSADGRFEHNERLIPFGVGRRYCMGEQLARGQVFIALADLIQRLRFLPPVDHPAPDMEKCICNMTRIPDDFHLSLERI